MIATGDTIFALATPAPPIAGSGIGIIRISGPDAIPIAAGLVEPPADPSSLNDRMFQLVKLGHDNHVLDFAGLLVFREPRSYTGEDVAEIHLHGGLAVIQSVQKAIRDVGARPAEPGEFTRRAFLNGRIDLVQAESIATLIGAAGQAAQQEALRQRSGELSEKILSLRENLRELLGRLEVDFDYPEEGRDGVSRSDAVDMINDLIQVIDPLVQSYEKGRLLEGFRLAIVGKPNVGKSSLLNMLLREERAIVTESPGTTRDVVSGTLSFGGVPAEVLDTAGIRAVAERLDTAEAEGIRRSWREVERAHLVLMVFDISAPLGAEDMAIVQETRSRTSETGAPLLIICNKLDLPSACPPEVVGPFLDAPDLEYVAVSALTGDGIENLRSKVCEILDLTRDRSEIFLTRDRHRVLLDDARKILENSRKGLEENIPQDVIATELWSVDRALGKMLGEGLEAADLDEIFSAFCVGK